MAEFFYMDGYAGFVWGSFAAFFIILLADGLSPVFAKRHLIRNLRARWARQRRRENP